MRIRYPSTPVRRHCRAVDAGQSEDANSADDVVISSLPCVALVAATVDGQDYACGGSMGIDMQIAYFGFAGSAQQSADPDSAVRAAFDAAEQLLERGAARS
jgi:hypothetical protein